jgi:hypothetical protein
MRGVPLEIDGEQYWFVPVEAGPSGKEKRDALYALFDIEEQLAATPDGIEKLCNAVVKLAEAMLKQNYQDRAGEIASRIPLGHKDALAEIALKARLPENFTQGASAGARK